MRKYPPPPVRSWMLILTEACGLSSSPVGTETICGSERSKSTPLDSGSLHVRWGCSQGMKTMEGFSDIQAR